MSAADIRVGTGTRGRIIEELALAPRTARDLAKTLGIQESAARGHLDRLEERGIVVPSFRREGVGRPRKRYLLTQQGQELFPRRYELLLDSVMESLIAREGEAYVSSLFADAARGMAKQIAREIPKASPPVRRAEALAEALNHLGFRSTVEQSPSGALKIVRTNCVFRHTALTHAHLLCDVFDKHLTEELLGQVGLEMQDSIGRGGTRCTHLIQLQ
ncbi:MAG TPA: ArsR family transcriptional regulator [Thermoplasmata archaeon]|nr:ArsR family transcriptional regulator [Thermoplasmata archaeon]HEV2428824.1 ArsR family transcriptional regulator [Thermoplasmata archaeon]